MLPATAGAADPETGAGRFFYLQDAESASYFLLNFSNALILADSFVDYNLF